MPAQIIFGDIRECDPQQWSAALEKSGVSRIDTAAGYQGGESEKIIGRAKLPSEFTIDTKIKYAIPPTGTLTPEAIERSLSNSLKVLGVDKVNVLYCHTPDTETPIAVTAKAMDEQYRMGRFTHLGLSNYTPDMVQEWLDVADKEGYVKPTWYEGQYNLLCRAWEEKLFPLLRKHNIHFAAYSPLAGGFLLGNFTSEGVQGGHRFTINSPFKRWYDREGMHRAIKQLRAISTETGFGMDELSLRWLVNHSALGDGDVIILGASKVGQIEPSVVTARKGPLDADLAQRLSDLWKGLEADGLDIVNGRGM